METALGVNIKEIKRENIERNTKNIKVKRKNLDILLDTNQGIIDVELNAKVRDYLHTRNMSYLCDTYSHYTLVGEEYKEEIEIIQINFTYGMGKKKKLVRKCLMRDEEGEAYVNNFILLEYNMDRIMELWYSKDELGIEKYKYLIMLDLGLYELEELSKKDRVVERYKMNVELVNKDPRFRVYMTEEEDQRKIHNTEMRIAREKGLSQGLSQGAKQNSIEVAKYLLTLGTLSIEQIAEATKLSVQEIENLK